MRKFFNYYFPAIMILVLLFTVMWSATTIGNIERMKNKTLDVCLPKYENFRFHAEYFTQEQRNIDETLTYSDLYNCIKYWKDKDIQTIIKARYAGKRIKIKEIK